MENEKKVLNVDLGDTVETQDELKYFQGYLEEQKVYKRINKNIAQRLLKEMDKQNIEYKKKEIDEKTYIEYSSKNNTKVNNLIKECKNRSRRDIEI